MNKKHSRRDFFSSFFINSDIKLKYPNRFSDGSRSNHVRPHNRCSLGWVLTLRLHHHRIDYPSLLRSATLEHRPGLLETEFSCLGNPFRLLENSLNLLTLQLDKFKVNHSAFQSSILKIKKKKNRSYLNVNSFSKLSESNWNEKGVKRKARLSQPYLCQLMRTGKIFSVIKFLITGTWQIRWKLQHELFST